MPKVSRTFSQFLTQSNVPVEIWQFVGNLVLSALLAWLLSLVFVKMGRSLSNRSRLARNFVLITMTTTIIITIVKSSLALSLGLVGALSIVRFRTAIKEPEELAYLFLCIAIGLGLGANQWLITVAGFAGIVAFIIIRFALAKGERPHNLFLSVTGTGEGRPELAEIVETLRKTCSAVDLKRFDDADGNMEALFLVEFDAFENLEQARAALRGLGEGLRVSFLDNKGIA